MEWIERQKAFLDYTLSSLWRRKVRNLSLLLVYALVIFLLSSVIFLAGSLREEARAVLREGPEMVVQRTVGGRHALIPESYAEEIERIRGASNVRPRLWGYYYHHAAGSNYTLMVPEGFSQPEDTVRTGAGVLRTWGSLWEGKMYFKAHDGEPVFLRPLGAMTAETDLVSADLILMSESAFRKISGVPEGQATDLAVDVRNERERQVVASKIVKALPDARPILKEEILRTYESVFDWRSGYVIVLFGCALLAFFIFAWDKATGLSAEEKTEIGILKGIGWDTADVLVMKFWEGAVVSLLAFLLGVIAAYVHVHFASATLFEHALKGWAVLYPEFTLRPRVDGFALATLFFLTVVPYTLLTIVPTWKAAVTDPDSVMRQ